MAFRQVKSMQKWTVFGAHLSWRRIFCPSGITRQKSTERSVAFCRSDLERVKRLTLYSVYLTDSCPPNFGFPFPEVCMKVSKVSSMLWTIFFFRLGIYLRMFCDLLPFEKYSATRYSEIKA